MGWLIFGGVMLALILLLTRSITATVDYGERFDVKIKYLFFTLYPTKPKKDARKRRKRPAEAAEREKDGRSPSEEADERGGAPDDGESGTPSEGERTPKGSKKTPKKKKGGGLSLGTIMEYIKSASPPIKRLFKKIRVRDLSLFYTVGTDDAAKTAIKYGSVCAAVYPLVEFLTTYFFVKAREIRVEADFSAREDRIVAHAKVKLRLSTALGCLLWLGARIIKTYINNLNKEDT
ncbi:MAG: DUF2953 domain-containing protein [Bacteroides sp.]|nr:DUF2953 domain-containing protein [Eubacterium sp.]MCM1419017.1 DUF2953 domain-containing protein [Roseburia sp.]MCM1462861.1 DUF2953 domain-containing protein [Bacteroides sp.]